MLKFDEEKQLASVQGALALRPRIEDVVDGICKTGFRNLCWLGIGGTYASCLQAEVHMRERSRLDFYVVNAAEYLTTGDLRVGEGTIVVVSSVTGSTTEMVDAVKQAKAAGAKVLGFIDIDTTELARLMDWEIAYPANEQLKFYMVADRFLYHHGEFPEYDEYYAQLDAHLARDLVEVEKAADAFGLAFAQKHHEDPITLWARATSTAPPTPTPCAIGRSSIGFAPRASTPPSSSMECWRLWTGIPPSPSLSGRTSSAP